MDLNFLHSAQYKMGLGYNYCPVGAGIHGMLEIHGLHDGHGRRGILESGETREGREREHDRLRHPNYDLERHTRDRHHHRHRDLESHSPDLDHERNPEEELNLDSDCLSPCNMMEDVGLDDIQLVRISTKDLNKHLKRKGIDKNRQKEVKARRRTLKNRGYAASCRVKRDEEEENIKREIDTLDLRIRSKMYKLENIIHEHRGIIGHLQNFGASPTQIDQIRRGNFEVL